MDVKLGHIPETLLLPLQARAQHTKAGNPILADPVAVALLEKLAYDFSRIQSAFNSNHNFIFAVRAKQIDQFIKNFVQERPDCIVVNLGAGLDTTFPRVDNGRMRWYDLDLPEVIELRRELIPETDRSQCIGRSLFDYQWTKEIGEISGGVLLLAAGLLFYFDESELRPLFATLHQRLPGAHILFDAMSPIGVRNTNKLLQKANMPSAVIKWPLKDARVLESWGAGITLIEQLPYFHGIPRKGQVFSRKLIMMINDRFMMTSLVHCRV